MYEKVVTTQAHERYVLKPKIHNLYVELARAFAHKSSSLKSTHYSANKPDNNEGLHHLCCKHAHPSQRCRIERPPYQEGIGRDHDAGLAGTGRLR